MRGPPVDPMMRAILARQAGQPVVRYDRITPAEGRTIVEGVARDWNQPVPPVRRVSDLDLPGPAGRIAARLYRPDEAGQGLVIGIHGGGWTFGSLESHDRFFRLLALDDLQADAMRRQDALHR